MDPNEGSPQMFPIKEGYLTKEGRTFRTLKLRWFELSDSLLNYYSSQDKTKKLGYVTLNGDCSVLPIRFLGKEKVGDATTSLVTPSRTLNLFGDLKDIEAWKYTLENRIYWQKYHDTITLSLDRIFPTCPLDYADALIRFCIEYQTSDDIASKLFFLLGFHDVHGSVLRYTLENILRRFQPIVPESYISVQPESYFKISDIVDIMGHEWFSGFERYQDVEEIFSDMSIGSFSVQFARSDLKSFILSVKHLGGCTHWRIPYNERGYEIEEYISFPTIVDLIQWYSNHTLPGIRLLLMTPVRLHDGYNDQLIPLEVEPWRFNPPAIFEMMESSNHMVRGYTIHNDNFSIQSSVVDFKKALIKERISNSATGISVYRCNIKGMVCVVKIMEKSQYAPDIVRQFLDNIELLQSYAQGTHVVKYLYHCETDTDVKLFLEYLPSALSNILKSRRIVSKGFSPKTIATIIYEIAKRIQVLHSATPPIAHRNLNTSNIYLTLSTAEVPVNVKLSDFGFYLPLSDIQDVKFKRKLGVIDLEAITYEKKKVVKVSPTLKSDIYSLGIILYELLTVKFLDKDTGDIFLKGGSIPLPTLDDRYTYLVRLFKECVAPIPNERPTIDHIVDLLSKTVSNR